MVTFENRECRSLVRVHFYHRSRRLVLFWIRTKPNQAEKTVCEGKGTFLPFRNKVFRFDSNSEAKDHYSTHWTEAMPNSNQLPNRSRSNLNGKLFRKAALVMSPLGLYLELAQWVRRVSCGYEMRRRQKQEDILGHTNWASICPTAQWAWGNRMAKRTRTRSFLSSFSFFPPNLCKTCQFLIPSS